MPQANKKEIEGVLQEGMDALTNALRGIGEAAAQLKPLPDLWSVRDCVEHIALTEEALLTRLKEAKPAEASHADPQRETRFRELAMNRERRIDAPGPVRPATDSRSLNQAIEAVHAVRTKTLAFLDSFNGDLRSWLTQHPLITRPVNCYEMLLLMALHPKRHAQQIMEIREQLLHPRSQM